jgi:hypothetical protein
MFPFFFVVMLSNNGIIRDIVDLISVILKKYFVPFYFYVKFLYFVNSL